MAKKIASRSAQYPLVAVFDFDVLDTMADVAGVQKDFKSFAAPIVAEIIPLPPGAVVLSGEVVTDTAVVGSTAYNVSLGDSVVPTRYLGVTDKKAAGRTALVPTGYLGNGENLRITVTPTVADATVGKLSVRVMYVIKDRSSEVQIS